LTTVESWHTTRHPFCKPRAATGGLATMVYSWYMVWKIATWSNTQ